MQTYLVGGAVRDARLNIATKDRDWVVVGSTPQQMLELGYQQVGADFPVFLHPQSKEEYALARTERKSGHGYAGFEVAFDASVSLEEDLLRRDLTINAMALSDDGTLIDPYGGEQDLNAGILRHVSDAFREDPLRVLRIARFAARFAHLGFTIAAETEALLGEMSQSGELEHLVAERVWAEMSRALSEPTPAEFFRVLKRVGALKVIFPELDALFGVPQTMRWHPEVDTGIHTLMALQYARSKTQDITVLMAVLCHDLGKALTPKETLPSHHGHEAVGADLSKTLAKRYKWPNAVARLVEDVARFHTHCHRIAELKPSSTLKLLKNLQGFRQEEKVHQFALACEADFCGRSGFEHHHYPQANILLRALDACSQIQSHQFVAQGLTGKAIGEAIDQARIKALHGLKANR